MQTIRLRIDDKIYKPFMWLLQRFSKDEIEVIHETNDYLSVKEYLEKELDEVEEGSAEYISLEKLDEELENTIKKHED